jgi:polar amino acid transport system substrate-binding protein
LVLGARRGSSYGDDFERGRREIFILDEDNNAAERLSKLLAGRIDVALIGPGIAGFRAILRENPQLASREDEFAILPVPFSRDPNYLGFPKSMKMGDFIARFNEVLREGQDSGAIREIIENLFH